MDWKIIAAIIMGVLLGVSLGFIRISLRDDIKEDTFDTEAIRIVDNEIYRTCAYGELKVKNKTLLTLEAHVADLGFDKYGLVEIVIDTPGWEITSADCENMTDIDGNPTEDKLEIQMFENKRGAIIKGYGNAVNGIIHLEITSLEDSKRECKIVVKSIGGGELMGNEMADEVTDDDSQKFVIAMIHDSDLDSAYVKF